MGLIVKRAPIPRGFPPPFFPMTFPSALWERQISSPLRCESLRFLKAGFVYLNDTHVLDIDENNWTVPSLAGQGTPASEVP